MNIVDLDFNRKEPFLLDDCQKKIGRVVTIALPFIAMYKPAAKILMPLLHLHEVVLLGAEVRTAFSTKNKEALVSVASKVSLLSLSLLFPSIYLFFDLCYGLFLHLENFKEEFIKENLSKNLLFGHLSDAIYCAINLALFVKPNKPELLMASFLIQGLQKSLLSIKEYDQGHYMEFLANSALSLIKLNSFQYYAEISYRNHFGKVITQKDLNTILLNLKKVKEEKIKEKKLKLIDSPKTKILTKDAINSESQNSLSSDRWAVKILNLKNQVQHLMEKVRSLRNRLAADNKSNALSEELKKFNYKNGFKDLIFDGSSIEDMVLKDFTFSNVIFKNTSATECIFKRFIFDHCEFLNGSLTKCLFINSIFNDTLIQEVKLKSSFLNCFFNNVHFIKIDAKKTAFYGSFVNQSMFIGSHLKNVQFDYTEWKNVIIFESDLEEATFFEASVENSSIEKSNLKNTLLLGAKDTFALMDSQHEMTKRIIGLVYDLEGIGFYTKKIEKAAKKLDAVIFPISSFPIDLDEEKLGSELTHLLVTQFKSNNLQENEISQFIVKEGDKKEQIAKISHHVKRAASYCDGLIFPGGENVPEEFYKKEVDSYFYGTGYSRALTELFLLKEANSRKIPSLLICRGLQILNVSRAGTLRDVKKHWGTSHVLKINPNLNKKITKKVQTILQGNKINAHSVHKQAIERLGNGLIVGMMHEGSPELIISDEKVPLFVGTQFHPEYYLWGDKEFAQNEGFFLNLQERIEHYAKKIG